MQGRPTGGSGDLSCTTTPGPTCIGPLSPARERPFLLQRSQPSFERHRRIAFTERHISWHTVVHAREEHQATFGSIPRTQRPVREAPRPERLHQAQPRPPLWITSPFAAIVLPRKGTQKQQHCGVPQMDVSHVPRGADVQVSELRWRIRRARISQRPTRKGCPRGKVRGCQVGILCAIPPLPSPPRGVPRTTMDLRSFVHARTLPPFPSLCTFLAEDLFLLLLLEQSGASSLSDRDRPWVSGGMEPGWWVLSTCRVATCAFQSARPSCRTPPPQLRFATHCTSKHATRDRPRAPEDPKRQGRTPWSFAGCSRTSPTTKKSSRCSAWWGWPCRP